MNSKTHPDATIFPNGGIGITYPPDGLTKREYFAAQAMVGLIAHSCDKTLPSDMTEDSIANISVVMADALIKRLNK